MPTETFNKLSQEKKEKIINAAKKEFGRVVFSETSIKNIALNAGISRGSLYQYFESKEDLLRFLLEQKVNDVKDFLESLINNDEIDIFDMYIKLFQNATNEEFTREDYEMMKMIFFHSRMCDEKIIQIDVFNKECTDDEKYYDCFIKKLNIEKLKVGNKNDLILLIKILNDITKKAIYIFYKSEKTEEQLKSKQDFYRTMELMKSAFIIK